MTDGAPLRGHSLLAIVAHPDDESLACGGLLALCALRGARVAVLCLTRGEHGAGQDLASAAAGAAARTRELHAAARVLGVAECVVRDHRDGYLPWIDATVLEHDIGQTIAAIRPEVVVTFDDDGLYWHPDHIAVHERTTAAVSALGPAAPALYYVTIPPGCMRSLVNGVAGRGTDGRLHTHVLGIEDPDAFGDSAHPPTHIVDVRAFAGRKLEALRCHATQVRGGAFEVVADHEAPRWLGTEHYRRAPVGSTRDSFLDRLPETAGVRVA